MNIWRTSGEQDGVRSQKDVNGRYATATAMNSDLQKGLKSPASGGKSLVKENGDSPTQKVPIVGANIIDKEEYMVNINSKKEKMEEMGKSKKKIKMVPLL